MSVQIEAVFENGVFRPTRAVPFHDRQKVRLTIDAEGIDSATYYLEDDVWTAFCNVLDAPSRGIPQLQRLLVDPGVFDAQRDTTR